MDIGGIDLQLSGPPHPDDWQVIERYFKALWRHLVVDRESSKERFYFKSKRAQRGIERVGVVGSLGDQVVWVQEDTSGVLCVVVGVGSKALGMEMLENVRVHRIHFGGHGRGIRIGL